MTEERRRWSRVKVWLPCEVQLILPEETFQPRSSYGYIIDLSVRGARVRVAMICEEIFRKLLRPDRYAKLLFSAPESEAKIKVIGNICWLDFKSKLQELDMGTFFENVEPESQIALQEILRQT